MIQLSLEQRHAVRQGKAIRMHDPDVGEEIVVCSAALFENMKTQLHEMAEDDREVEAWLKMSMQSFAQRLQEEDNV